MPTSRLISAIVSAAIIAHEEDDQVLEALVLFLTRTLALPAVVRRRLTNAIGELVAMAEWSHAHESEPFALPTYDKRRVDEAIS